MIGCPGRVALRAVASGLLARASNLKRSGWSHDADLAKQKSDFQKQNEAALKEVEDLKRKFEEQKTANQLGDGAEINLYEDLRREFPGDPIGRVPKGQPGPDIHHDVLYKGEVCGQIVYDSKKQQAWRREWIEKLRQDQVDAGAEHAVLASTVFPTGKKEVWIDESGVIVVHPARAVHIAHLLRKATISMHVKGLAQKERAEKTKRIYEYITSNEHEQKFDHVVNLNKAIQQVDADEKEAHSRVWNKRGTLLKKQQHTLEEIGKVFALTRERIRQIEAKALRKLRKPAHSRRLRAFLDDSHNK